LCRETPNRPDDERQKEEDAEHDFDEAGHRSNVRAVSVSRYDLARSAFTTREDRRNKTGARESRRRIRRNYSDFDGVY
jgi:hypothetical protein